MLTQECSTDMAQDGACATNPPLTHRYEIPVRNERIGTAAHRSGEWLEPRAAALELLENFQRIARALSPRDRSTQDDLVQEMCLAALECEQANTRSFFLSLGAWRAKNFLAWWKKTVNKLPDSRFQSSDCQENAMSAC